MTIDQLHRELGVLIEDGWEGLLIKLYIGGAAANSLSRIRVRHATIKRTRDGESVPDLHVALEFEGEEGGKP